MYRRLTEGPLGEKSTARWAEDTIRTIENHWFWHKKGEPELSGAQCNFLIELQRAADNFLRYCKDTSSCTERAKDDLT